MNRVSIIRVAVLCLGLAFGPSLRAEYDSIKQTDVATIIDAQAVTAGATYTSKAFKSLRRTVAQSAQIKGTGTGPNYKVEILVSLDGTNFVKPETGGDLGTFTDQEWHIMAISVPLSVEHKFKVTELGGANTITVTALEASQ